MYLQFMVIHSVFSFSFLRNNKRVNNKQDESKIKKFLPSIATELYAINHACNAHTCHSTCNLCMWNQSPLVSAETLSKCSCEDSAEVTSDQPVLTTGCRRKQAGQCGYWKGMTGCCGMVWATMENIGFALSMLTIKPVPIKVGLEFKSPGPIN